jgi:hypothetical protein
MRFPRKRGATSVKARIFIPQNDSTTGAGKTGLAYGDTNLAIAYSRENDNGGTEVTGAGNILDITTIGTWQDPGAGKLRFKAVDATKMPGLYEIQFPDAAAFGTADTSQNLVVNVYEKTTSALKIGPNMVLIPLSARNVLDGESDIVAILGAALTGTAAQIVAAFTKFFDKASPTGTVNSLPDAVAGANGGLPTTNGTVLTQTVGLTAGQSIACSDKTGFSLSATGADLILKSSTFIQAIVAAVNEFATYGLTALNTLLVTTGIKAATVAANAIDAAAIKDGAIDAATFAAGAIDAAAIANGAIDNATFAADVGSTAYATNIIALAADKALANAALATAAELAKVPKSDSNVTWNATALGSINAEVDTALNTAIPGGPTADSINQRIAAIDVLTEAAGAGDLAAILLDTGTTLDGRIPAALVGGKMDSHVNDIAADAIAAAAVKADAVTKIQNGLATPTNITAGTITTVTNLTNAPTNGDLTATMKTSVQTAASAATPAVTVSDKTGFALSSAGVTAIWAEAIEGTITAVKAMRAILATAVGKLSGAATTTVTIRDASDTKNRITATVTADGDRTAITTDLT